MKQDGNFFFFPFFFKEQLLREKKRKTKQKFEARRLKSKNLCNVTWAGEMFEKYC